jgi:hypothetical protein
MNGRIPYASIVARITQQFAAAVPALVVARVGHCMQNDYMQAFIDALPGVWVVGQRFLPTEDKSGGYSGNTRQHGRVEIGVRCVMARYVEGSVDAETLLDVLHRATAAALIGWKPTGADKSLLLLSAADGPADNSIVTIDMVFQTEVTYTKGAA